MKALIYFRRSEGATPELVLTLQQPEGWDGKDGIIDPDTGAPWQPPRDPPWGKGKGPDFGGGIYSYEIVED